MSRAFVKESDQDAGDPLPELAISPHVNYVTPEGMQQIDTQVRDLEAALSGARAAGDIATQARVDRDLRYWMQRRSTARLVPPRPAPDAARFGVRVALRFDDGVERSFRLVGEDEADPARGLVSWVSPVARALTGKTVGDRVDVLGGAAEIIALD